MARQKQSSRVVKISREVDQFLSELRQPKESYDGCLRRYFGLPARNGHEQPLATYFVIDTPKELLIRRTLAEAKGEAILIAVRQGQKLSDKQRKESVRVVREVP